jgi:hypothetical protein
MSRVRQLFDADSSRSHTGSDQGTTTMISVQRKNLR